MARMPRHRYENQRPWPGQVPGFPRGWNSLPESPSKNTAFFRHDVTRGDGTIDPNDLKRGPTYAPIIDRQALGELDRYFEPRGIQKVSQRVGRNSPPDRIRELQRSLVAAGFDPGKVDGRMGPRTEKAVRAFQKANGLDVDGKAGAKTLGRLASGTAEGPSRLPRPRPEQPWGPPGAFPAGPVVQGPPEMSLAEFNRAQAEQSGVNLNTPQSRPPPGPAFPPMAATGNTARQPDRALDEDISVALRSYFEPEKSAGMSAEDMRQWGENQAEARPAPPNALGNAMREFFSPLGLGPPPVQSPEALQSQGMSALRSMPGGEIPQETIGTNDSPDSDQWARGVFRNVDNTSPQPFVPRPRPDYDPAQTFPGNEPGDIQYSSPITGTFSGKRDSHFGANRSWGARNHAGADWQADDGSLAHAVVGGTVVYTGHHKGYQYMADILGDDGNIQRYATHGKTSVNVGDKVKTGDPVGTIGRGHLHFEVIPPSSPAFEMAASGQFGSTSWKPLRDPKSLDPAEFFGVEKGAHFATGQPLNAAAMDARREGRVQEARRNLPMRGPNDMGPPEMTMAEFNRLQAQQHGVNLNTPQSQAPGPLPPTAEQTLRPPAFEPGLPGSRILPDEMMRQFGDSAMPALPQERLDALLPSAPAPQAASQPGLVNPQMAFPTPTQSTLPLAPGALPGGPLQPPPQMASVNPDPLMDPNMMMAPGPLQGQVDPFAPPTGMLTPPVPLGPPQPGMTARLPRARPAAGPEFAGNLPRPKPALPDYMTARMPRPRPDDPSAPGKTLIIDGQLADPNMSPFDAINIMDGDIRQSRRIKMSDDKRPLLSQPPLTAGPIEGALGSMNSGIGPRSFWDAFNARPQGPTDIARASRIAAHLYRPRKEDKDDAERRKMAEARAVAIISQAAAGGNGYQNHGGGGMFGGGWGGWGGGNYHGGNRYGGPGTWGYTNKGGGA